MVAQGDFDTGMPLTMGKCSCFSVGAGGPRPDICHGQEFHPFVSQGLKI